MFNSVPVIGIQDLNTYSYVSNKKTLSYNSQLKLLATVGFMTLLVLGLTSLRLDNNLTLY